MEYQTHAVPVLTSTDLAIALSAGAEIQFTSCPGDSVKDARSGPNSGRWIVPVGGPYSGVALLASGRLRAFYPAQASHDRYMAATAVLRDEE